MSSDCQSRTARLITGTLKTSSDVVRILIGSFFLATATGQMAGAEGTDLLSAVGGPAEIAAVIGLIVAATLVIFGNRLIRTLRNSVTPDSDNHAAV